MSAQGDCDGLDKQSARPHPAPEYAPIRPRFVPPWLPFSQEKEFLRRFHAALARALARRGGRWRNHRDEARTNFHILGGLYSAYRHGRVGSSWGRSMLGKKGQKALQTKLAMRGEQVVEYFAELGRRGGLAKARKRREAYMSTLPREQRVLLEHQQAVLSGQRRPTRPKSWMEL